MENRRRHSKIGIAACTAGAAAFAISGVVALLYLSDPSVLLRILFIVLLPMAIHAVCLVLSLTALFFPNRRKFYPALGAGLNALFLVAGSAAWIYFLSSVKLRVL